MDLKIINFLFSKEEKNHIRKKQEDIDEFFQDIGTYYKVIEDIENLKKRRNSFYKQEMLKTKMEFLRFIKRKIKEDFLAKILKESEINKTKRTKLEKLDKSDFRVIKKDTDNNKE